MSKRIGRPRTNKGPWLHAVKRDRAAAAAERDTAYHKLTTQEKIAKLDKYGHTATKERAKLKAQL